MCETLLPRKLVTPSYQLYFNYLKNYHKSLHGGEGGGGGLQGGSNTSQQAVLPQ
jgi:hypothetical protein